MMINKLWISVLILLIMMAYATILAPTAALGYYQHHLPVVIKGPGLLPPQWSHDDVMNCWTALIRTDGCVTQIYEALYQKKFDCIGPACCEYIMNVEDSCWPRMFPFHPKFPLLLKMHCADFEKS
jgi:hypothetical protein